jgi:hypothetical protein
MTPPLMIFSTRPHADNASMEPEEMTAQAQNPAIGMQRMKS